MNLMYDFFTKQSSASTMLYLCLTAFTGVILGKLEIKGIKLGIAGVLFSGIFISHFGVPIDSHILYFIRDFGLVLFVYSIGLSMGPRFFTSFKKDGLILNLLAIGVVLGGFGIACLIYYFTDLSSAVIVGTLCGAVTNTPSLGAAQQVLAEQGAGDIIVSETGMAYAIAYPFGILGIIITMLLIRLFFKIDVNAEIENYTKTSDNAKMNLQSVEITVSNHNLLGKNIDYIKHIIDKELAISRIIRNGESFIATDAEILQEGDIICGVSSQNLINNLEIKIGKSKIVKSKEGIPGPLSIINVLLTNQKLSGKTIEQIGIYRRYPANITRIYRSGIKILPTLNTTLELGDTIRIVGKQEILNDVKKELGNSINELAKPNIISIFLGIFVGILLGSLPVFIPGIPAPAKLGLAGGPLLVAILLGYKGHISKLNFYMTPGANLFMRELGIILFPSCVGLLSGEKFVKTIQNGGWQWMLYGIAITLIPILVVGIIARLLKINYLKICGFISGSMSMPPLEFDNSIVPVQAQAAAYATVYPITMFLRVLFAQIFCLVLK
ncbi:MAG: putative transporter [Candidatus Azobacteroides pseudotrichonymphae]|nr:MAG: putative transporter [Candidatus Azobacteroides pseudotrichonymphae]